MKDWLFWPFYVAMVALDIWLTYDYLTSGDLLSGGLFAIGAVVLVFLGILNLISWVASPPTTSVEFEEFDFEATGTASVGLPRDDINRVYLIDGLTGVAASYNHHVSSGHEVITHSFPNQLASALIEVAQEKYDELPDEGDLKEEAVIDQFITQHVESEIHELTHWALTTEENDGLSCRNDDNPHSPRWNEVIQNELEYLDE